MVKKLNEYKPEFTNLPIKSLLLDPSNPRLKIQESGAQQVEIAREIAQHYDAISLARLIAHNGFYESGALFVYKSSSDKYIVAEGNRRLTAVLGLVDPEVRAALPQKNEWKKLAESAVAKALSELPVFIFDGPSTLRPIIAAEHLNRKLSWEPYQKAREIVHLIDIEGMTFEDISSQVGLLKPDLKRMYRDFKLVKTMIRNGFPESLLSRDFSKVGEVTKIQTLSDFGGIPRDRDVEAGPLILDNQKTEELNELFNYVFSEDSVTPDSRQIRDLGKVITREESLTYLRDTRDLPQSLEIYKMIMDNNTESTLKVLNRALDQLERIYSKVEKDKTNPMFADAIFRAHSVASLLDQL
jgi:ParB-like chromosome segregation protein Spo0J